MDATIRDGDRAFVKIGRNLVEVGVVCRAEGGWRVATRTGREILAKTLLDRNGEPLAANAEKNPEPAAESAPPPPSPKAVLPKGLGLLSAAAAVLERSGEPMQVRAMIKEAKSQGLWTPKGGKTPEQTLYSAIVREIRDKGEASRFRKEGRGRFAFAR